ncbi:DUF4440 domain-containing protein [Alkalihalobacillus sp. LMS6]|uniref:nuclear transport factor 2 family protein n=1 Tax=Alkalihalobacillus sp. LMS6 TaxID=2924034 RepID=UPI0020D0D2BB|nr:DUF4440 domain-containing protein [Alkalihalobacillus sp. LMS6]UTR07038.1 DUF4440 domain-containing protein [Alkalihalobacillus sp. LMS6]
MDLIAHIKALEESHLHTSIRTSGEALGQVLADDFFEFGSSGRIFSRQDFKDGAGNNHLTLHDWNMHQLDNKAVLTTYRVINHDSNKVTLRSSVWKLVGIEWKLFFHQGTIVPTTSS